MKAQTTQMSSRGQIVIPKTIRDYMNAEEGTIFAVAGNRETIILKKVDVPLRNKLIDELSK